MGDINQITNPDHRYVNGPVNIIRLEGKINNIQKVIYLFLDYHIPVSGQTECSNVFSQDIQKYLADTFHELSKSETMYDFFVEIYPTELASSQYIRPKSEAERKNKYIEEVVKLFRKIFRYDSKNNKVRVNKLFQNIRLHYLDIRDYYKLSFQPTVMEMRNIALNAVREDNINYQSLVTIINLMHETKDYLQFIISVLQKTPEKNIVSGKIIQTEKNKLDTKILEYLARKIKSSYKYPQVKKAMNDLLQATIKNFKSAIAHIDSATIEFNKYAKILSKDNGQLIRDENTSYLYTYGLSPYTIREMVISVANHVEKIADEEFVEFFARFTDIYFLRRFLDKDYITHAMVYSGALHSNTYINVLVKKFNFRVTHASYSKIKDMAKLNTEIKKRPLMEIQELILPEYLSQCSNLSNFPPDFL